MKIIYSLFLLFASSSAFAKPFTTECSDLVGCINAESALTGDKYLYNDEVKLGGHMNASSNFELTPENAAATLTGIFNFNGLARIPAGPKNTYFIIRLNDAKGSALPSYPCSFSEDPKLPDTWDLVRMEYKMKNPETVKRLENFVRTYAPMGARIYGNEVSGTIAITASAAELKSLYSTIRASDVKVSAEKLKEWKIRDEKWEALHAHDNFLKMEEHKQHPAPSPAAPTK